MLFLPSSMLPAWNANAMAGTAKTIIFFEITLKMKATDNSITIQNNPDKVSVLKNISHALTTCKILLHV